MILLRVLAVVVGMGIVLGTLLSAVRTVVVPRAESVALTRLAFGSLRVVAHRIARLREGYAWTDRVMALYPPVALLTLPLLWLTGVYVGFSFLFWAAGEDGIGRALEVSGSSLLTLGFTKPDTTAGVALSFVGAGVTIAIVVLLLVTYLPSMYAAFSDREQLVDLLETRAGSPPTGVELIIRLSRVHGLGQLNAVWIDWEEWFARVQESHTSLPALVFFRSQRPERSWVTAAGALLDGAALFVSCVDHHEVAEHWQTYAIPGETGVPETVRQPEAEICIRAGYLCLRELADFLRLPYDPAPAPDDPIAVTRDEFDEVWQRMELAGVPLVDDPEEAWRAFTGWRVNYDEPLLRIADHIAAPPTPWVSDRSPVREVTRRWRRS